MNAELIKRIETALDTLENLEHRVSAVIEGGRQQLSHLVGELKIRELRQELRNIVTALQAESAE